MALLNQEAIGHLLEGLYRRYRRSFLPSDPLQFVHRYTAPHDQEIVGLLIAVLAYGDARQIIQVSENLLRRIGPNPSQYVKNLTVEKAVEHFGEIRYRFTRGVDLACLLLLLQQALERYGSLRTMVEQKYREGPCTIQATLTRFVEELLRSCTNGGLQRLADRAPGVHYLLPSPSRGSACKRLNLYMRWMVRDGDGIDLGLFSGIPAAQLVIPLDTHIMRISRLLGLTHYRSPSWRCAEDITTSLRLYDPADPLKYDFSLTRLGIHERVRPKELKQRLLDLLEGFERGVDE